VSLFAELVAFGLIRFGILVFITTLGWFFAFWIRKWFQKKCRWSHNPKYLKIEYFTNFKCDDHFDRHTENEPLWAALATWICQEPGCNGHGKKCFGSKAWWKIEHGQMVVDEKRMTDPGKYQTPKEAVEEKRRREGQENPAIGDIISRIKEMELKVIDKIDRKLDEERK
jgi:hypothetical protein